MKLIHQSCTSLIQEPGISGIYKQIETAGRTCYKSLDKITEDSAKPFVDRMIASNHTAMLEHGTVYMIIPKSDEMYLKYSHNKYSKYFIFINNSDKSEYLYVTTNLRVIAENDWWDDLKYLCEPTDYHEKRYTLLCTTALHCYKDLTRHRTMSFAIESTRYCNYNKNKFGGELTFIIPSWCTSLCEGSEQTYSPFEITNQETLFMQTLYNIENTYLNLISVGEWQAQQAAEVLPQCIKGDMVITGFESDWKHLLDLRYYGTTGAPHPMVKELATLMKEELNKQGLDY